MPRAMRLGLNIQILCSKSIVKYVAAEQGWRNCSLLEAMAEGSGKLMATLGYGVLVQDMSTGRWLQTNKEV